MTASRDGLNFAASTRLEEPQSVPDQLSRIGDGDPVAWAEVVHRYTPLVSATVKSHQLQDADAHDAIQTTWLQLMANWHWVKNPERLGRWLATTARRECLRILRQRMPLLYPIETLADIVADPSVSPEQRTIDAHAAQTLWKYVDELPPTQRTLLRALFTDDPQPYSEIARTTGIPRGVIGPTRARALQKLRRLLDETENRSPESALSHEHRQLHRTIPARSTPAESDRTGSYLLDHLLDKAEQGLREKLEPKVTNLGPSGPKGTGDGQLDELLHRADAALRAALNDHETTGAHPSWPPRRLT